MKIVTVIPLKRGMFRENLTYFTTKEIENGSIVVNLPDYVEHFAKDFTVHVTPVGKYAEIYCTQVKNGSFTVYSDRKINFNWVVYGTRLDIETEPLKKTVTVKGTGPYRYL